MSQSDPTDHALAAIASILDQPSSQHELEEHAAAEKSGGSDIEDANGYSKYGPGPVAAMRFTWTVRRENRDEYFVDETVGDGSRPIVSGPMSKEAAVRLVDHYDSEARRRFDLIKDEMTGHRKEQ